jgi:hypothetical protein
LATAIGLMGENDVSPVSHRFGMEGGRVNVPLHGGTQVSIPWGMIIGCIGVFCCVHVTVFGIELIVITRLITRRRCGASASRRAPHFNLCLLLTVQRKDNKRLMARINEKKIDATDCRTTHLLRCCCHGYAQKVLSWRSCTHLRHSAQKTRWGSTCASSGSARSCAARCSAFRLRDSLPMLGAGADKGGSGSCGTDGG